MLPNVSKNFSQRSWSRLKICEGEITVALLWNSVTSIYLVESTSLSPKFIFSKRSTIVPFPGNEKELFRHERVCKIFHYHNYHEDSIFHLLNENKNYIGFGSFVTQFCLIDWSQQAKFCHYFTAAGIHSVSFEQFCSTLEPGIIRGTISETRALSLHHVSKREKQFYCFRAFGNLMKPEARVFEITSPTKKISLNWHLNTFPSRYLLASDMVTTFVFAFYLITY